MKRLLLAGMVLASACTPAPPSAIRVAQHRTEGPGDLIALGTDDTTTTLAPPPPTTSTTEPEPEPEPEPVVTTAAPRRTTTTPAPRRATTTVYEVPSPQGQTTRGDTPPEYVKQCESGGSYTAVNPNGHYGAFQFSQSTWDSTAVRAGRGDLVGVRPDRASVASQDELAAVLWDNGRGASHWECA